MSKRTILVLLTMAAGLGACSQGPSVAWTAPGWYLELPYTVIGGGPAVYGGPMTYDECEAKRLSEIKPERFLCVNETKRPTKFGFY